MVITLDFDSSNPGSNPGETSFCFLLFYVVLGRAAGRESFFVIKVIILHIFNQRSLRYHLSQNTILIITMHSGAFRAAPVTAKQVGGAAAALYRIILLVQ